MLVVDRDRCVGCGNCVEACLRGAVQLADGVARIDQLLCVECGVCATVCPNEAIQAVRLPAMPWGVPLTMPSRPAASSPMYGEELATLKAQTDALRERAGELIRRIDELKASWLPASER